LLSFINIFYFSFISYSVRYEIIIIKIIIIMVCGSVPNGISLLDIRDDLDIKKNLLDMTWNFNRNVLLRRVHIEWGLLLSMALHLLVVPWSRRVFKFLMLYTIGRLRGRGCFRLQVRETPTLLGPVERANLNQFLKLHVFWLIIIPSIHKSWH
jgi:hypothetical protein